MVIGWERCVDMRSVEETGMGMWMGGERGRRAREGKRSGYGKEMECLQS